MSKINKRTYEGELTCPNGLCESKAIRFVDEITKFRHRYCCRKCGLKFQYDLTGREDLNPCAAP